MVVGGPHSARRAVLGVVIRTGSAHPQPDRQRPVRMAARAAGFFPFLHITTLMPFLLAVIRWVGLPVVLTGGYVTGYWGLVVRVIGINGFFYERLNLTVINGIF